MVLAARARRNASGTPQLSNGALLAPLLETIDSSIVNVALPMIYGNLGATIDQGAWVVTAYIIVLTPWMQSRFGRRQHLTASIIGFTIASMLCGAAQSIDALIALRVVQGLFGGGLIATTQATLRDMFPPERVGASQGLFAIVILIGPIIAPMIGGTIVDSFSWRWIFYINLLPVDVVGIALPAGGLGSLQFRAR